MAIKRGVSFYSYQEAYYNRKYDLEGLVKATAQVVKAEGVEILAEETPVGSFPDPLDADVERWFRWMEKYGTKPVCMDSFIDYMMFKGRFCTLKEQVQMMERDLKLASRLGFSIIRVLCPVRKEVVEASIPAAERYGVKMGLEVHWPMMLDAPWVQDYIEMFDRSGSKCVGIIPDFGIFQRRPPRKMLRNAVEAGASEAAINRLSKSFDEGLPGGEVVKAMEKEGAGPAEMQVAAAYSRCRYNDPAKLRDIAKYILSFHGKFYDMDEDCVETSIDYEGPIKVLKKIGFDGYINSEFEGQRLYTGAEDVDEVEQVRRHHVMLKALIGD